MFIKEESTSVATDELPVSRPAPAPWLSGPATSVVLCALLVLYAASRFLQVFPGQVPMLAIVALHVCCPAVFALIHGALRYGVRVILLFAVLCLAVGSVFESLGVLTGFPYGHYYFTDVMSPKLFVVPVLLALAYWGMGYLSWTLAGLILGGMRRPLVGARVVTLPLVASFVMVAWDLSMDPIWSTYVRAWIWRDGRAYFACP
jgi:putative membrane protein